MEEKKKYETKMIVRFDIYIYIPPLTDKFNSFDLTLISFHLRAWTREDAAREREREKERMEKEPRLFSGPINRLIDKCVKERKGALFQGSNSWRRQSLGAISIVFPPWSGRFGSLLCNVNAQQTDLSTSI